MFGVVVDGNGEEIVATVAIRICHQWADEKRIDGMARGLYKVMPRVVLPHGELTPYCQNEWPKQDWSGVLCFFTQIQKSHECNRYNC